MSLEHVLLGMLREPASGYDLRQEFQRGASHFWSAGLNQIYPTLQRMESKSWLRSREEPSEKGPPRRVYTRTAKGSRELKDWLSLEPQLDTYRLAYIGQLVFMGQLDDLSHTREFIVQLRGALAKRLEAFARPHAPDQPSSPLKLLHEAFENDPASFPVIEFHYLLSMEMGQRSLKDRVRSCDVLLKMIDRKLEAESDV